MGHSRKGAHILTTMTHTSFVYAARFHPLNVFVAVSGCVDGKLRLWSWHRPEVGPAPYPQLPRVLVSRFEMRK
jgi:hypothetical protein